MGKKNRLKAQVLRKKLKVNSPSGLYLLVCLHWWNNWPTWKHRAHGSIISHTRGIEYTSLNKGHYLSYKYRKKLKIFLCLLSSKNTVYCLIEAPVPLYGCCCLQTAFIGIWLLWGIPKLDTRIFGLCSSSVTLRGPPPGF